MRLYTSELVKKYKARTVVNHVSIDVNQGEIVGLLGPNGAGKTTTFYMIVGLIKPNEGQIFLEDDNGQVAELTKEPVYRRAQMGVGYLAQEASVFRRLSVEDNIKAVLEMTDLKKDEQAARCEALIEEFRLQKVRKSLGIQLSGGEVQVEGLVSSQFITGLLLALPIAEEETTIHVPHVISTPYIDITIDTAERFGIEILHKDYKEFYVAGGQRYRPAEFEIESDWSAAAFLLVAGAVAGEVTIRNLSVLSRQADTAVMTALIRAGASVIDEGDTITVAHRPLQAFSFDATQCPGLFPALAALAASAEGTSVIKGTSRLENKEGNRAESIR